MVMTEENLIYKISNWIMKLVAGNILWLLFSLPITVIIFASFFTNSVDVIISYTLPLILSIPVFLFPATAALFALARSWILKKEEDGIIKSYFRYYKINYKNSILGGVIFTGLWCFWIIGFLYLINSSIILGAIYLAIGVFLYAATMTFFSVLVHYDLSFQDLLKNTSLIVLASPLLVVTILISNLLIYYLSIFLFQFMFVLVTASFIVFTCFYMFNRFYESKIEIVNEEKDN